MLIEYYERWYSPDIETMNDDSDEDNGEDGERLKRFMEEKKKMAWKKNKTIFKASSWQETFF